MKKIVVACDSFKGSLSSWQVAEAAEAGILESAYSYHVVKVPVADGGEGTVEALADALHGVIERVVVNDALMRPIEATYAYIPASHTAVIEMAKASGLAQIAPHERNPMKTTSYGTGEIIGEALNKGCRNFLIGIGGSATNDGGIGMLEALGYRFYDKWDNRVGYTGECMSRIARIDGTYVDPRLSECTFTIACDVNNPFWGKNGAAYVFARQKGADDEMIEALDNGLQSWAGVIQSQWGIVIDDLPGAGAAGGLGGAFVAFMGAQLKSGIDMVLDVIGFDDEIKDASLVITGEGRLDKQTVMGKTPAGVLRAAQKYHIPVVAIGGGIESEAMPVLIEAGFAAAFPIVNAPVSLSVAMETDYARRNVQRTVSQIFRILNLNSK